MRISIVNGIQYMWYVKRTGKYERLISIKSGSKYCTFTFENNITPRMIRRYIEWNPNLENKPMTVNDRPDIYNEYIDSLLHATGVI